MCASNFKGADSAPALLQSQYETPSNCIFRRRITNPWEEVRQTYNAALEERGLGARMVEMKPGETRGF